MKNLLKLTGAFIVLIFIGCTVDETEETNLVEENDSLESEDLTAKTSGGSCGSSVNFQDLVVETSWISGKTDDRDQFGACGVDGESWMDKYSDGRVMMKCLSGDGHRTELKEDSGDEAALNQYKKMQFIGKLTNIPENGVTIAQIHNRGSSVKRPWIRVYVDDDRYIKIKETETNPTGSSSTYTTYTGLKYTSGAEMNIIVWTGLSGQKKGKVQVKTGGSSWSKTLWPSSAWSSKSSTYYLKAGVYTEGNDKTATMKYSYFYINH